MIAPISFARNNGWPELGRRAGVSALRRVRDRMTARHLAAPGFRAGGSPRLLGLSHMSIGSDFSAGDGLWLEAVLSYGVGEVRVELKPRLSIGVSARLSDNVHIACLDRLAIGDHLLCGSHVLISDHSHGRYDGDLEGQPTPSDPVTPPALRPLYSRSPVRIGNNVWLGDGVAVLAGAEIGDGCVIGANSVVAGPIPPQTMAVGAPARPIRRWDQATRTWLSTA